jgi:hypothetical protein
LKSGQFSQEKWNQLIRDTRRFRVALKPQARNGGQGALDTLFLHTATNARDLKEHAENIKSVASRVDSVTAFVKRADWEPLLAAGFPRTLTVYQSEDTPLVNETHRSVKLQSIKGNRQILDYTTYRAKGNQSVDPLDVESIEPTELLVVDKINDAEYLNGVLQKHGDRVNKMIMIHGTQAFGDMSESDPNKPGLFHGIKAWISENPDWFVMSHWANQYGLTVLACEPMPRPVKEIRPWSEFDT